MSEFIRRNESTDFYYLSGTPGSAATTDRSVGIYAPLLNASGLLRIAPDQAFNAGCVAFFLGAAPENQGAFEKAFVRDFGSWQGFVWITQADAASLHESFAIRLATPVWGSALTSQPAILHVGNLSLNLPAGTVASYSLTKNAWTVSGLPGEPSTLPLFEDSESLQQADVAEVSIGCSGMHAGRLHFSMVPPSWLLSDCVGIRFFPLSGNSVSSIHFAVFPANPGSNWWNGFSSFTWSPWRFEIDPSFPFDASRTCVKLGGDHPDASPFPTNYVTTVGNPLWAAPQPGSQLSFVPDPHSNSCHLAPSGRFLLKVNGPEDANGTYSLLCGLSGLEFVRFPANQNVILEFIPGSPAGVLASPWRLTPTFSFGGGPDSPPDMSPPANPSQATDVAATTSWCYVLGSDVDYFAQPSGAPLFEPHPDCSFLTLLECRAAELPVNAVAGMNLSFPMAPFGGLATWEAKEEAEQIELMVLSPSRRAAILKLDSLSAKDSRSGGEQAIRAELGSGESAVASRPQQGATPHGLLTQMTSQTASQWASVQIARGSSGATLALSNVGGSLKSALQTNQQFIVCDDPSRLSAELAENNSVDADGWTFDLNPAHWSDHGTIVVFKYFVNKSLYELIHDTSLWTQPSNFCVDSTGTQQNLVAFVNNALQRWAQGDANYEFLATTVIGDPASGQGPARQWQGILVLNCYVPLTGLPPALMGLSAGISPSNFYAHHLGFNMTPLRRQRGGPLQTSPSSMFALIHYVGSGSPAAVDGYSFHVDELEVSIVNSEVTSFSSEVTVALGHLFDYPAVSIGASPPGQNTVQLQGYYQAHNGRPTYVFVGTQPIRFSLAPAGGLAVISSVEIQTAKFSTLRPPVANSAGPVASRFDFSGVVGFAAAADADLLSYEQLPFSQLGLVMNFSPEAPLNKLSFTPDFSQLVVSSQGAVVRPGSLVQTLPLRLRGFTTGSGTPNGTFPVQLPNPPGLSFAGAQAAWFGLVFDLDMGTLGALANRHLLSAALTIAWTPGGPVVLSSPGPDDWPLSVWLQLPGVGGELGLEGVLGLTLQSVELDAGSGEIAWALRLRDIGLKVLGVTLPISGAMNLELAAPPSASGRSVAWYAAYTS